jgi:phage-related protein
MAGESNVEEIRQRIIIEGADGALKELEKLGDEGSAAIEKLKAAGNGDFAQGIRAASPEIAAFQDAFAIAEAKSRGLPTNLRAIGTEAKKVGATAPAVAAVGDAIGDVDKSAVRSTLSLRQLALIMRGIGRASGVSELGQASRIIRGLGQAGQFAGPAIALGLVAGLDAAAVSAAHASQTVQDAAFAAGQLPQIFQAVSGAANAVGGSVDKFSAALVKQPALIKATAQGEREFKAASENIRTIIDKSSDSFAKQSTALRLLNQSYDTFRLTIRLGLDPVTGLNEQMSALNKEYQDGKISTEEFNKAQNKLSGQLLLARRQQAKEEEDFRRQIEESNVAFANQAAEELKAVEAARQQKAALLENATALEKLNIGAQQFKNLSLDERMNLVAQKLLPMEKGFKRNSIALELFGDDARKFIQRLDAAGGSFDSFVKEGQRIAPVFDTAQNAMGDQFLGSIDKVFSALGALKNAFGFAVSPAFIQFFNDVAEAFITLRPIVQQFGQVLGSFLKPILDGLGASIRIVAEAVKLIASGFDALAGVINKVFGTDISGAQLFLSVLVGIGAAVFPVVTGILLILVAIGLLADAIRKVDWGPIKQKLQPVIDFIVKAFTALWGFIKDVFQTGVAIVAPIWDFLKSTFEQMGRGVIVIAKTLWNGLVQIWNGGVIILTGAWDIIVAAWHAVVDPIVAAAKDLWKFLGDLFNSGAIAISDAFNTSIDFVTGKWVAFKSYLQSWVNSVIAFFQPLIDRINKIAAFFASDASQSSLANDAGINSFASGGKVAGPGSGTSDSILAWVSNGEFVMRMRAVQKYGLGFMQALNEGRLSLDNLRGFNLGGLVSSALTPVLPSLIPRFADGGPVIPGGGMRPVSINFEGTRFDAFMMEEGIRVLSKHSNEQRMRRAGRRPSYVGG